MADISFKTEEGKFNYRVGCILTDGERLLIMRDEGTSGHYLPGGRIHFGEKAEDAAVREMQEELAILVRPVRLLWVKEGFFTEFSSGRRCHEIALYFLLDASESDLLTRGNSFDREDEGTLHHFSWAKITDLADMEFYPLFLKKAMLSLPDSPVFVTEMC